MVPIRQNADLSHRIKVPKCSWERGEFLRSSSLCWAQLKLGHFSCILGNICLRDTILFVSMCICTFRQTLWWFTPPLIPYWFGIPADNQVFSRLSQAALCVFYVSIPAQWFVRQVLYPWLKTIARFCCYSRKHRVKYSLISLQLLV